MWIIKTPSEITPTEIFRVFNWKENSLSKCSLRVFMYSGVSLGEPSRNTWAAGCLLEHHIRTGIRREINCVLRDGRITRGIFFVKTFESNAFKKICSSHQSPDWDAFDIAWGKGARGGYVEEVLLVRLYCMCECAYMCVCVRVGCTRGLL